MKPIFIYKKDTQEALYGGDFSSYKSCLEDAVKKGISLEGADLTYKNLSNITVDNGVFEYADFSHSNLTGANMSETKLDHARFYGSSLYNTCLAESSLRYCDFEAASFGATDVNGSDLSYACFSTLSCFSLDFSLTRDMEKCVFKNPNNTFSRMSRPPLVITGRSAQPIIVLDEHIKIGSFTLPYMQKYIDHVFEETTEHG